MRDRIISKVIAMTLAWALNAAGSEHFVAQNGQTPDYPFSDWTSAASNIQEAVNAAWDIADYEATVRVGAGVYLAPASPVVDQGANVVHIKRPLRLVGEGGREQVIIDGEGVNRGIMIRYNANTELPFLIEGLTVRNCRGLRIGGGIQFATGPADVGGSTWTGRVVNCVISNNTVEKDGNMSLGGGIGARNYGGLYALYVEDSLITGNKALPTTDDKSEGGGIYARSGQSHDSPVRVLNSQLVDNEACHGGAVRFTGGLPTMEGCLVRGNTGKGDGGGVVFSSPKQGLLRNSLFYENTGAARAGAIYHVDGKLAIDNCTVVDNSVASGAGGIHQRNLSTQMVVSNTIVAFNTEANKQRNNVTYSGQLAADFLHRLAYCCVYPDSPQALGEYIAHQTTDPLFEDRDDQNYRLSASSPCIDSGDTHGWMSGARDFEQGARLINAVVDRGCYEYSPPGNVILIR